MIRSIFFILVFSFVAFPSYGQKNSAPLAQITNEEALIYQDADFDSQVIATLGPGGSYPVSQKKFGAFHRIRLKDGKIGYISDVDFRIINKVKTKQADPQKNRKEGAHFEDEAYKAKRPLSSTRLRGPELMYVNFREETMGLKPTEGMWFVGFKLTGADTVIEGDVVTDMNVLFKYGAPNYYQQATGYSASGWIMILDSLFQMPTSHGKNILTSYGFGPMFKYSRFQVTHNQSSGTNSYSAEDMTLGVSFNLNIAYRFNSIVMKGEWKYFWEKMQYQGYGLALQYEF